MGQPFGAGQAAIDVASAAIPLSMVVASALYLRWQHQRYGRLAGWPGQLTLAALLTGLGLAALAVWPLPAATDGLCSLGPATPPPLTTRDAALFTAAFLPVGLLARARFRRGVLATVALGAALALAVTAVRATGLLGLYPCAPNDVALAAAGVGVAATLLGWLLARWVPVVWPFGPHRSWPAAVPDRIAPDLGRRMMGAMVDVGLWWFGAATLVALAGAYGAAPPALREPLLTGALLGLAGIFGLVVPLLRRDRCTPGAAALRLALTEQRLPCPASRVRTLVRTALLYTPVALLVSLGLPWFALAVVVLHASTAVVRPDGAGLADLLCGVRVRTRSAIDGDLPRRLVRYSPPREEAPAPV
ncbi:antibiotic resistance protein VanZ [Nocardiopsis sp. NPDC006938]|uniref:antibiotic resistance protein VanZ n=1 Tax=Nocardiopsis sp. NPDC006938 TaxID=3364337 RepID=UPI0036CDF68B